MDDIVMDCHVMDDNVIHDTVMDDIDLSSGPEIGAISLKLTRGWGETNWSKGKTIWPLGLSCNW